MKNIGNIECGVQVQSMECQVWSVRCGVWYRLLSVDIGVGNFKSRIWSVECIVLSEERRL